jgi:hypothetical protein
MRVTFVTWVALLLVSLGGADAAPRQLTSKDMRLTVERLAMATYDALRSTGFDVQITKKNAVACGCATLESYDQNHTVIEPIASGAQHLGARCKRMAPGLKPSYQPSCGKVCGDADGSQWVSFCPPGMRPDCKEGCAEQRHSALGDDVSAISKLNMVEKVLYEAIAVKVFETWVPTVAQQKACDCDLKIPIGVIPFGLKVGVACKKNLQVTHDQAHVDASVCGGVCAAGTFTYEAIKGGGVMRTVHKYDGWDTYSSVHFCPPGWVSDCNRGCVQRPIAPTLDERVRNAEQALTHLFKVFPQALPLPDAAKVKLCGCDPSKHLAPTMVGAGKSARQVGWTCFRNPKVSHDYDWQECGPKCKGDTVNFCPAGFRPMPSCSGCLAPLTQLMHDEL